MEQGNFCYNGTFRNMSSSFLEGFTLISYSGLLQNQIDYNVFIKKL